MAELKKEESGVPAEKLGDTDGSAAPAGPIEEKDHRGVLYD